MLNIIKKVWNSFVTACIDYNDMWTGWLKKHWKGYLVICMIGSFIAVMWQYREFVIEKMKQTTTKIKAKVKKIFKK